uniref:Uncharacterized protein n=1 Tax=viral metagenome TaxID=1070528 RepID=A0A6C0C9M7_9ZZZZ
MSIFDHSMLLARELPRDLNVTGKRIAERFECANI